MGQGQAGHGQTPPRRPRNRRGQGARLRDELIDAARQLLMTAERESDLSIRAVSRAAGTAPQSFYLQFDSLDELLYAVYAIEYGHLRQAMADAAGIVPDPAARLAAVARAYCDYAQANPVRYRILAGVRGQAHPEWAALPGTPAFTLIADTAAQALASEHPGADPFLAAAMLWACLHGIIALRADRPAFPWPPLADMIDSLIRQILTTPPSAHGTGPPARPRAAVGVHERRAVGLDDEQARRGREVSGGPADVVDPAPGDDQPPVR